MWRHARISWAMLLKVTFPPAILAKACWRNIIRSGNLRHILSCGTPFAYKWIGRHPILA
jgi:hypothetical protein